MEKQASLTVPTIDELVTLDHQSDRYCRRSILLQVDASIGRACLSRQTRSNQRIRLHHKDLTCQLCAVAEGLRNCDTQSVRNKSVFISLDNCVDLRKLSSVERFVVALSA
jgi:hypothetical protein